MRGHGVGLADSVSAGQAARVARRPRFVRATNRVSGALLVGAGAGLAGTGGS